MSNWASWVSVYGFQIFLFVFVGGVIMYVLISLMDRVRQLGATLERVLQRECEKGAWLECFARYAEEVALLRPLDGSQLDEGLKGLLLDARRLLDGQPPLERARAGGPSESRQVGTDVGPVG